MNKTIFSIAFLAASGGYVAYANHAFDGMSIITDRSGTQGETALEAVSVPQLAPAPSLPPASKSAEVPSSSQLPAPALASSSIAPALVPPTIVAAAPVPQPLPKALAPAAPEASVQQAQSTAGPSTSARYHDGSYTGTDENAYYGRVQVQAVVSGGQITSVKVLDYPSDRRTSRYINSQALPMLAQEVVQAQSAAIDAVSGATLTSEAYIRSLSKALSKAAGNNA